MRYFWLLAGCTVSVAMFAGTFIAPSAAKSGPDEHSSAYQWPVVGKPRVINPFEAPASRYAPGHRGVDLAASSGDAVLAAAEGTVSFAGQVAGRVVVTVSHPDGIRTSYEPLITTVTEGQLVTAGQHIGIVALGHHSCPSNCLHWGARIGENYIDPLSLLGFSHVRLLPL